MASNSISAGAGHLITGLKLLRQPGLRRYVLLPVVINVLVFLAIGWIGYSQFSALLDWMLPESGWLSFLRWILWPLFALTMALITFYTFTLVANLIAAPFNGLLAERVEQLLTGTLHDQPNSPLWKTVLPLMVSELRKLGYFLIRGLPLLILTLIPGINLIASPLWLLFSAWYLCLEYLDYPMGNAGYSFPKPLETMRDMRYTALGFGGGVTLLMMIPLLNLVAMPAAVAGATALWCAERGSSR